MMPALQIIRLLTVVLLAAALGCERDHEAQVQARVDVALSPSPPRMGETQVTVTLQDPSGEPLTGAQVKVEGNMNHAGMVPVFADLTETRPGDYTGTLKFTMPGDWFLLIDARLPGGGRLRHQFDVPAVKAR